MVSSISTAFLAIKLKILIFFCTVFGPLLPQTWSDFGEIFSGGIIQGEKNIFKISEAKQQEPKVCTFDLTLTPASL